MRRYPPEVDEVIWAGLCEGVATREIGRRLAAGAGLPNRVVMPRRTLNDRIARLKRQRGLPTPTVNPGTEAEVAGSIVRRLLEACARTEARLSEISKERPLSASELATADKTAKVVQDISRRMGDRGSSSPEPHRTPDAGDFLAQLASATRTPGEKGNG